MTETFLTELRNALSTEKVKPGDEFHISRGQKVIFGSNPKRSLRIAPDTRSIRLVKGIKPHQLSRAAIAIEFSQTEGIIIKSLTENNQVALQYQSKEKPWQIKPLRKNQVINAAEFTGPENLAGDLTIDITTDDNTLVRLYCCGGGGDRFDFRVDINPVQDLNNSK